MHGVPAVRFDAVTGLLRQQRRRHDPAGVVFFAERAIEPGATGASFIDKDPMWGLRWHLADEVIDGTLTRPNRVSAVA